MVEGPENVIDDSSIPRNDDQNIPGTRLEPMSDKESPEVEITNNEEVEITNVVIPVNVNEEEEEITVEEVMVESLPTMVDKHIKEQVEKQVPEQVKVQVLVYVAKGLLLERQQNKEKTDKMIAKAMLQERGKLQAEISSQVKSSVPEQQYQLYLSMKADPQLQQQDIAIWLALQMKFKTFQVPQTTCRTSAVRLRDQDDPHDDAHLGGENNAKRQKTFEYETYVTGESFRQVNEKEQGQSFLRNQEQTNDYDFWTESYASDDDEVPMKQQESGKPKEVVYSNSKIIQVIKTYWELGYEHKFITKIVARRANECIVPITEPDYKNLNKNDIEDMYLLIMNGKKVNLTAPTISFPGIEKHKMFSIIYEPVHGIIYKNSKKEKRVMRHSEIHKFCDATLNRVLEGLKSYNNDVKYGYIQRDLIEDEVEYLKLFVEEIEVRLKYRNQMRRWEMYVNGRPLGPRRERPE
ncbi:hypothetical protein Tco_0792852 [Tanacetum coccineum]